MKILALSDIHGALKIVEEAALLAAEADLVVLCGDITRRGHIEEAEAVLDIIEKANPSLLAVHGNWDGPDVLALLRERGCSLHADGRVLDGVGFFGAGGAPHGPLRTVSEYSDEEISGFLAEGYKKAESAATRIMVTHAPPRGARDRTLIGLRAGSRGIRDFLAAHPADLCLCGHIHEVRGTENLRGTVIANPGTFRKGWYLTIEIGSSIVIKSGRVGGR